MSKSLTNTSISRNCALKHAPHKFLKAGEDAVHQAFNAEPARNPVTLLSSDIYRRLIGSQVDVLVKPGQVRITLSQAHCVQTNFVIQEVLEVSNTLVERPHV